jgi:hypothetical protein
MPNEIFQFVSVLQKTLQMVVCSFSWANEKDCPILTIFSSPQLCQILCLKKLLLRKIRRRIYLRPVRDGLIGTWSIGISNTSGSDTCSEPTTFGSEAIRLGLLSLPRALGRRGRCHRLLLRPRSRAANLFYVLNS